MAFYKERNLRLVPWMSFNEWKSVYKQVYSNDVKKQKKSYETLLVWKARAPVLPAGIDCTLELLEVYIRDREWSAKIEKAELPIHYENDLRKMYSTAIMRLLNHICHLGKTKDSSLYKICQKMNIPDWVVDLRHDAAHSHELPPIISLRNAANLLFAWLHNEYWAGEYKFLRKKFRESLEFKENEKESCFVEIIELWIAAGLYIKAGYEIVKDVPNDDMKKSLFEILSSKKTNEKKIKSSVNKKKLKDPLVSNCTHLKVVQNYLLLELTRLLNRRYISRCHSRIICDTLLEKDSFLPDSEFLQIFTEEKKLSDLPENFLEFWQNLILYLQKKKLLQPLFVRLLTIVDNDRANKVKRHMASLWVKALLQASIKQKQAKKIALMLDQVLDFRETKLSKKLFEAKVKNQMIRRESVSGLTLNFQHEVMECLRNEEFLKEILLMVNEYSVYYIEYVCDLMKDLTEEQRDQITDIVKIFTEIKGKFHGKIYTIEDLEEEDDDIEEMMVEEEGQQILTGNMTERNSNWKLPQETSNWKNSPIGFLPWNKGEEKSTNSTAVPAILVVANDGNTFSPGILDDSQKTKKSQINWDTVIKKKKTDKRKQVDEKDRGKSKCMRKG